MAGMSASTRQQHLKSFPPSQQRAIAGATQAYVSAYKKAATSITSSTTLAADSELVIAQVQANVPYSLSALLNLSAMAAAGNVKFDFSASTAVVQTMVLSTQFYTSAGVVTQGAIATALTTAVDGGTSAIQIAGLLSGVVVFSSPGSFGMRFAQKASSATATVVDVNSFLLLEPIIPAQ